MGIQTPANATARLLSAAASDNATQVNALPCELKGVQGVNKAAYDVFLKLYAGTGAAPVVGDVPRKTLCLPAGGAFALDFAAGIFFRSGLSYRVTKLVADADATALVAGDVVGLNIDYAQ